MSNIKQLILKASQAPNNRARIEAIVGKETLLVDTVDIWSESDRDRLANDIKRAIPALQLLAIHRELLKIDRENLPTIGNTDDPWPDPLTIDRPSVPEFPAEALPEPLRSWTIATAEACQVPTALPGLLTLAICGGACARRVEMIAGRGWTEPINLYVAILLEPANRKTAVFASAFKPLRVIERELVESASPTYARLASARRSKEKALAKLEKRAGETGDMEAQQQAGQLAEELALEPIPSLPKLLVDDATAEAIEMQLAAQGGRLIVAGCEGGLFDVMAGRYSSGIGNLDCFLKGHAGDDLRTDRVTRRSIVVDRCCLTLAYAVQPDVIRGMADRPSFRGRGLIGRFLYAIPESRIGLRRINPEPVSIPLSDAYESIVRRLATIPDPPDGQPWMIGMSLDASELFVDWQSEVETMLSDSGRMADFRDWGGKLCGLTARLAAIMHLVTHADEDKPWSIPVDVSVLESAIVISRWAIDHASAVIRMMDGGDTRRDDAAYLSRWLRERKFAEFSRRDAHVHGRSRFDDDPERLDDALLVLSDCGWIRPLSKPQPRSGRPPSQRYSVNPRIFNTSRVEPVVRERGVV